MGISEESIGSTHIWKLLSKQTYEVRYFHLNLAKNYYCSILITFRFLPVVNRHEILILEPMTFWALELFYGLLSRNHESKNGRITKLVTIKNLVFSCTSTKRRYPTRVEILFLQSVCTRTTTSYYEFYSLCSKVQTTKWLLSLWCILGVEPWKRPHAHWVRSPSLFQKPW